MALAIDASTPAPVILGTAATSLTSNTFSPPANSLILVAWGNGNTGTNATSATDSLGSHLSYTPVANGGSTTNASTGWYWAECPSAQTNMTVTIGWASSGALYVMPVVFTGADPTSPIGATNTANLNSGSTFTLALTPGASGSIVICMIDNGFDVVSPTVPAGQTITIGGGSSFLSEATHSTSGWVQTATALTTAGTPVTINDTAPAGGGGMSLIEVLAPSSPADLGINLVN